MRRRVGVSVVKKKESETERYNKIGKSLEETKLSFVKETLASFQKSLAEFASKHKDRINSDPEFRQQFHKMCVGAGVDPLASNKGFWADVLGVGDFYFELGVKIVQIAVQTRAANGGIMSIKELYQRINTGKGKQSNLSHEDIKRAVEKLSILGGGFRIVYISGNAMIMSVPMEINNDHEFLISAASDEDGVITEDLIRSMYGWTSERFALIINPLLREGIVWVDDFNGVRSYYFPSVWKSSLST